MAEDPNITLYTGQSPNGIKISITLEELGLPYNVRKLDMAISEQKSDWFTEINPNGRQGQANHFLRYAAAHIEYAATRYQNEVKRLYGVLDKHLEDAGTQYLVGNKCTIADIAHWGWITLSRWAGVELSEFPTLKAWEERMLARPAVEKGRHVPDKHHREILQDPKMMEEFEKRGKAFYRKQEQEAAERKSD